MIPAIWVNLGLILHATSMFSYFAPYRISHFAMHNVCAYIYIFVLVYIYVCVIDIVMYTYIYCGYMYVKMYVRALCAVDKIQILPSSERTRFCRESKVGNF